MKWGVVLAVSVASLAAASALGWMGVRQEREFHRLIAAGDAAVAADRTFDAIEAFSGALALKAESMLPHVKRGDAYRRRGEYSAALRDLRQATLLDPTAVRPVELLGDVNAAMGRHERAADHYRHYLTLDDRAPRVLYKLALAHYRRGSVADALEPLRKAVGLDDRFAEAHYLLGQCLRDTRRTVEAMRALMRAIEINPRFAAPREALAEMYAALDRPRDSIAQLEALAEIDPARPERLVGVGLAYARFGQPEAAILTLGRAADRYPEAAPVSTALGRVWLDAAEARDDAAALTKALEALHPAATRPDASSETLTLYGRALLLADDPAGAERVLQRATGRLPVHREAFQHLATAAQRLGHRAIVADARLRHAALVQ